MAKIPVLEKTIRLLETLAGENPYQSMTQLAKAHGISNTTCFRILKTLETANWVQHSHKGGYVLATGLLPLVHPLLKYQRLLEVTDPVMRQLSQEAGLAVKLTVRSGSEAVTIARVEAPRGIGVSGRVGARFGLVIGSSGACLLADATVEELTRLIERAPPEAWTHQGLESFRLRIKDVQSKGYCADLGGYHPQVHAVSAPIGNAKTQVLGALTVLGLPSDFAGKATPRLGQLVKKATEKCLDAIIRNKDSHEDY